MCVQLNICFQQKVAQAWRGARVSVPPASSATRGWDPFHGPHCDARPREGQGLPRATQRCPVPVAGGRPPGAAGQRPDPRTVRRRGSWRPPSPSRAQLGRGWLFCFRRRVHRGHSGFRPPLPPPVAAHVSGARGTRGPEAPGRPLLARSRAAGRRGGLTAPRMRSQCKQRVILRRPPPGVLTHWTREGGRGGPRGYF